MSNSTTPSLNYLPTSQTLFFEGGWELPHEPSIQAVFQQFQQTLTSRPTKQLALDGGHITSLDSIGIWWLEKCFNFLKKNHISYELKNFSPAHLQLLKLVTEKIKEARPIPQEVKWPWFSIVGKTTLNAFKEWVDYISLVGEIFTTFLFLLRNPTHIQWRILCNVIQTAGFYALPITGLLSFLIGIVLAYQMGLQLRNYGANVYVVDLLALSILREFAPMMTAIIVAGRSGSAFTAQIGTMKVNQEIDALYTLGIKPVERLILPKLLALLIALPLITVWADIMGLLGGMIMAKSVLGIDFHYFIDRFDEVVPFRWYFIGLVKTPVFALIIASVGCFQGLQVRYTADSVGTHTTRSVVQAIFAIITFDALFSILLSWLKV